MKGANVNKPMPGVKNSMAGPAALPAKGAPHGAAPAKGQTYRPAQTGSTSPQTDAGGGVGNTSGALDKYLGRR